MGRQEGPEQPEEARRVFRDDPEHSHVEIRYKRLGTSLADRILIVSYAPRNVNHAKEIIRILSARQATRKERQAYVG